MKYVRHSTPIQPSPDPRPELDRRPLLWNSGKHPGFNGSSRTLADSDSNIQIVHMCIYSAR